MGMVDALMFSLPVADLASAFWESTFPGQAIVVLLVLGSAGAWTIMITKRLELGQADRTTFRFLRDFRKEGNPMILFPNKDRYSGSPLHTIYGEGCKALCVEMQVHGVEPRELFSDSMVSVTHRRLTLNQLETMRAVVERHVADEALVLEDQMGLLATAVSAAPFLGLLGTVWGVMDAFSGMASSGSAALSAVAPGISGALLTTIVGLLVALPSMIGYNLLSARIRRISVQMDNFAQEFVSEIQNNYVVEQ